MMRKGRLHKPCRRCGELFQPTTKKNFICPKCNKKRLGNKWLDSLLIFEKQRCEFVKIVNSKRFCTNRFNDDYRTNEKGRRFNKRCLEEFCPKLKGLNFTTK